MNLSGTLSDWSVADLLNVMKVTEKTASVHIKARSSGRIHFSRGRVVGAELEGHPVQADRAAAADSMLVLWSQDEGTFEVVSFDGNEQDGWDVEGVMADVEHLRGLEEELAQAELQGSYLMLRDEITEPVTVEPSDWWALASLVSVLSFSQLEEVFGRGRAIRLLHTLWRLELVEAVEPPDEVFDLPAVEAEETVAAEKPLIDFEPDEPAVEETEAEFEAPAPDADDESWLDEIAAAAESGSEESTSAEVRALMGVSAPASTVLTGSVLDEMRRLRVRPSD